VAELGTNNRGEGYLRFKSVFAICHIFQLWLIHTRFQNCEATFDLPCIILFYFFI
jgi:hypothetical protein